MHASPSATLWWARRDLRLADNPALLAAVEEGAGVVPLFVLDPVLLRSAGRGRRAWLVAALHALDADLRAGGGPGLSVVEGRPADVLPRVAAQVGATTVHVSADFAPYGRRRDAAVGAALAATAVELRATGSPYGVAPGTLRTQSGRPFQVFTPFHRAWADRGVHGPAPAVDPAQVAWLEAAGRVTPEEPEPALAAVAGERHAQAAWRAWLDRDAHGPADYKALHNVPGVDATTHLSPPLRWGHLHPRTVLADLAGRPSEGAAALARQVVWRDFYADVLFHRPDAVTHPIKREFVDLAVDDPVPGSLAAHRLAAWEQGRTGYPLVDAGMRQMIAEGWMHNRLRLVTGSFLVKDLHLPWWHGADVYMRHLRDGDVAQNQLNWQWVAGCGNDPAMYVRIFNPVTQSEKFDPDGRYIRRYVPELAGVPLAHLHTPWTNPDGLPRGYPHPIVDHATERRESLDRYAAFTGRG
ncbi:deoxyribodipyrimidine photo-lyase type I [Friedmanniella luteola]|uniref:Deoxyribodipyrimidine photo-lyase type I n=1 Tax=Friedmanniella luteola TaxID=546871 RepID=A0A1H1MH38_9ACTN|nr:deoxyribodipyrimidine photo-lyase [Friedmanniella luteola]SDR85977.1 deoxyribodipyrimidine photo-lyase type I [Friedmanniella luteola]